MFNLELLEELSSCIAATNKFSITDPQSPIAERKEIEQASFKLLFHSLIALDWFISLLKKKLAKPRYR